MVFVDIETTGADAHRDRITEIGVVEVGPDGVVEWDTLLNPETSIPPFIQRLTGIDDAMVRGKPTFESIAEALAERLEGKLFVAHNARFDYGFLKNAFRRAGVTFRADVLCTVRLSRALFPSVERHGLDALIARFGLAPKGRHRALADAELLWQFWQRVHGVYSVELVQSAVQALVKRPSLPAGLEETALDAVPDSAGVYLFYGDNDIPLYVGKSIHLRQRIGSHFSGDYRAGRALRMSRAVRRVEWHETGGEIGALLLEAQLVKQLQPVHNQLLRRKDALFSWELPPGLTTPRLRSDREIDFSRHDNLFGVFLSRSAAKAALRGLAATHRLCESTLSLARPTRRGIPCFARQVRLCEGACDGNESMVSHGARVALALSDLAVRRWPFTGPIAWRETQESGQARWHVVEDWSYLGSVDVLEAAHTVLNRSPRFDFDTYQILAPRLPLWQAMAVPLEAPERFALQASSMVSLESTSVATPATEVPFKSPGGIRRTRTPDPDQATLDVFEA